MKNILVFVLFMNILACDLPSRHTGEFAYLNVEELTLDNRKAGFTDVWYSKDGRTGGVFELPQLIPVERSTVSEGIFQPGIRENGINSMPRRYPFVDNFVFQIDLQEGDTLDITPDFSYSSATKIRINADFENENLFGYDEDGSDSHKIEINDAVGVMQVDPGFFLEEATSVIIDNLPQDGSPVYIEIEYRGDLDIIVGLLGTVGNDEFKEYFVSLRSETEWKKAYINLTDLILASELDSYRILLGADNSAGDSKAEIYIDNIKMLHF